jgi:hypothetical protein
VEVGGTIVFWHTTDPTPGATTTALYGFRPGDEGVISALTPVQIQQKSKLRCFEGPTEPCRPRPSALRGL